MNGLMVGFPPRSICSRVPSRRRLIDAHTPITGPSPSMSLGTSSAMESTLLSAKSSCPVHWNPCRAPSTSAKNGSLRSPADSRIGPAWTGWAVPSKLTGRDAVSRSPAGSGCLAWAPVAYQAVPVCLPFSYPEKVKVKATSACASPLVSMLIR